MMITLHGTALPNTSISIERDRTPIGNLRCHQRLKDHKISVIRATILGIPKVEIFLQNVQSVGANMYKQLSLHRQQLRRVAVLVFSFH